MERMGKLQSGGKNGFTIVELLIVIVVIAILASIVIVSYNGIRSRAEDTAVQANVASVARRIALFTAESGGAYPSTTELWNLGFSSDSTPAYRYSVSADGLTYCLTASQNNRYAYVSSANSSATSGRCTQHTPTTITNLVTNPSGETGSTGYSNGNVSGAVTGNVSRTTTGGLFGAGHMMVTFTASGFGGGYYGSSNATRADVTAGQTYTATMYLKSSVNATITPRISWYNSGSSLISSSDGESFSTNQSTWRRGVVTAVAPTNAVKASIFYHSNAAVWTNGSTQSVDGPMLTQGAEVYPYSDGTSTGWAWTGTPHASTSTGPSL